MKKPAAYSTILIAFAALVVAIASSSRANADDVVAFVGDAGVRVSVESYGDRKFSTIIRQQYDFSCGSAALATLLTHHYGLATTEQDAFRVMWDKGDQDRIREFGFSLLEMKTYLNGLSLLADGFRMTLDRVEEIGIPGIALIDVKGYRHFVVVKGISKKRVLVGDPSKGLYTMKRDEFASVWDGTILFVRSNLNEGKESFNARKEWRRAPTSPYDRAFDRETLQHFTLSQTRPGFSGFSALRELGGN